MTRAPHRPMLRVWGLALTVACAAVAQTAIPAQTGRAQERDLFVSVLDAKGAPVPGLSPADFVVREDKVAREVLRVRRATDPIDLAILIDNSQSSSDAIMDLRRGVEPFVKRMGELGHVAVLTVGDRPTLIQDYTREQPALKNAVGRLFAAPGSGATVLEGIVEVTRGLAKRDAERAALLVIWLGGPEFSNQSHLEVLAQVKQSGASLNVVTLGAGVPSDMGTSEGRHRESLFDRGTRETGGRRQNVLASMGLSDTLDKLASDFENQYRITYARPDTLIPPDTISVTVKPAGLTARGTPLRIVKKGTESK
jgi:Ca-activated chloride channel homolog